MNARSIFAGPTSVFIGGTDHPLLNWVAFALASRSDPEFHWTDVELSGQELRSDDPLARGLIPADRFSVVHPRDLVPDDATANMAVSAVIRDDETPDEVRRVLEFLRLPSQTQRVLSGRIPSGAPRVVVLSNAQRLVAIYPDVESVTSTVRAILSTGVVLIMTFADVPPGGRLAFDVILHLRGHDARSWREAKLTVEKAPVTGAFIAGSEVLLRDFEPIARVLAQQLG